MRWLGGRPLNDVCSSCRELGLDGLEHLTSGRQDAHECKCPAINDNLAIDQDLELPVLAMDHFHVRMQVTANTCRHPDGMEAGYSVRAVANCHPCHYDLLSRPPNESRLSCAASEKMK